MEYNYYEKKAEEEQTKMINIFTNTYPRLDFSHLKKQADFITSHSGKIYYIHMMTNQVFSWDAKRCSWSEEYDKKGLYIFFPGHRFYSKSLKTT